MIKERTKRKGNFAKRLGSKNAMWKGDCVGLVALHEWVRNYKKMPLNCEICGQEKKLDLANISQDYKRDLNDWEWLCRKCHMEKDGRLKALIEKIPFKKRTNKICTRCGISFYPCRNTQVFCSYSCSSLTTWEGRKSKC